MTTPHNTETPLVLARVERDPLADDLSHLDARSRRIERDRRRRRLDAVRRLLREQVARDARELRRTGRP
jgi:hypothetical protein